MSEAEGRFELNHRNVFLASPKQFAYSILTFLPFCPRVVQQAVSDLVSHKYVELGVEALQRPLRAFYYILPLW